MDALLTMSVIGGGSGPPPHHHHQQQQQQQQMGPSTANDSTKGGVGGVGGSRLISGTASWDRGDKFQTSSSSSSSSSYVAPAVATSVLRKDGTGGYRASSASKVMSSRYRTQSNAASVN